MTAAKRQEIREARDARKRLLLADEPIIRTCTVCGTDVELRTAGCRRCNDRHNKRRYNLNPEWRKRQNELRRVSRNKRRATLRLEREKQKVQT